MADFSDSYYRYKRTALTFLAVLIVLALPNVVPEKLSVVGLEIKDVAVHWVVALIAVAAAYYVWVFWLQWRFERRATLLSVEQGLPGILALVTEGLEETKSFQRVMQETTLEGVNQFMQSEAIQYVRALAAGDGRKQLSNDLVEAMLPTVRSAFDYASRRAKNAGARVEVDDDMKNKISEMVHGVAKTHTETVAKALERIIGELTAQRAVLENAVKAQESRVESTKDVLGELKQQINQLRSGRSFKFHYLDAGGIAALCVLAIAAWCLKGLGIF